MIRDKKNLKIINKRRAYGWFGWVKMFYDFNNLPRKIATLQKNIEKSSKKVEIRSKLSFHSMADSNEQTVCKKCFHNYGTWYHWDHSHKSDFSRVASSSSHCHSVLEGNRWWRVVEEMFTLDTNRETSHQHHPKTLEHGSFIIAT